MEWHGMSLPPFKLLARVYPCLCPEFSLEHVLRVSVVVVVFDSSYFQVHNSTTTTFTQSIPNLTTTCTMLPEPLISLILLATAAFAQNTATGTAEVAAAAATAVTSSPTSNVKGKAFDRFAVVWLENTDYDKSIGDRGFFLFPFTRCPFLGRKYHDIST